MANVQGGSIIWDLDIASANFDRKLAQARANVQSTANSMTRASVVAKAGAAQWSTAFGGVADAIGGVLTKVAIFGAAGAASVFAFTKVAGGLQTTSKQFEVLIGNTDQANKVYGELYNYVLGKPIAFPDASKAAATLLGYGRTAQQVVPDMKTLSTLSIVTGGDLQGLANVFGQVTSRGALFGQDALQLINNKIPLTTILAKKFGITMQEASERINGGKVSAEDFTAAMTDYANSLDISKFANTFDNKMISLGGSIRALGLALIGVKVDPIKGLVIESGGLFDQLTGKIDTIIKTLKDLTPVLKGAFTFIIDNSSTIVAALAGLSAAFLVAKVAAIGFSIAASINPLGLIAAGIAAVVAALVFLEVKFGVFSKLWGALMVAAKPVIDWFNANVLPTLIQIGTILGTWLKAAFEQLTLAWQQLMVAIQPFIPILKVIGVLFLVGVLLPIVLLIAGIFLLVAAFIAIATVVSYVINFAITAWNAFQAFLGQLWANIINGVVGAWNAITRFVSQGINNVRNFFVNGWNAIRYIVSSAWNGIKISVSNGVNNVINTVRSLPDQIKGFFSGAGNWLVNAGKSILDGLARGISQAADVPKKALEGVMGKIRSLLPSSPAKEGPFSGKGWTLYSGMSMMDGLAQGITNQAGVAQAAMNSALMGLNAPLPAGMGGISSSTPILDTNSITGGSVAPVQVTVNMKGVMARSRSDLREIGKDIIGAVDEELAAKQQPTILGGAQ